MNTTGATADEAQEAEKSRKVLGLTNKGSLQSGALLDYVLSTTTPPI